MSISVYRYTNKEKGWWVLHDLLYTPQDVRKYKRLAKTTGDYFLEEK